MAEESLPQREGESDSAYRRRLKKSAYMKEYYLRVEKDRRTAKPKPPRKVPVQEKVRANSPFTQEEWDELRARLPSETKEEHENRKARARHAKRREKDPDYRKEQVRAWREANIDPEEDRKRVLAWNKANPERVKASQKRHYHRHKEKRGALARAWRQNNPERARARTRAWFQAHPGLNAFYSATWRRACRVATPPWADLDVIRLFYETAKAISESTGVPYEVDHIVPVQGKIVCGLWRRTCGSCPRR